MMQGKIVKGIAGFYYVHVVESGIYACKAKGIFRKQKIKPLVGDDVLFEVTHEGDKEGNIIEILPRSNELIRPAASNVGQALIVFAAHDPEPNYMLLDRFLISMQQKHIPIRIVMNKSEHLTAEEKQEIRAIYSRSGVEVSFISVREGIGMQEVQSYLKDQTTILAGPSGVGKSSLTNYVQDNVRMETGEISKKLARGKNTTRHAELIALREGGYIFDTPGFSSFSAFALGKEDLRFYYKEFEEYENTCRFNGCVHINEPDCRVKEALERGDINALRYENYKMIYLELKDEEARRYR